LPGAAAGGDTIANKLLPGLFLFVQSTVYVSTLSDKKKTDKKTDQNRSKDKDR